MTRPVDMVVINRMTAFPVAMEVLCRAAARPCGRQDLIALCDERLAEHGTRIREQRSDLPDISDWRWRSLDR